MKRMLILLAIACFMFQGIQAQNPDRRSLGRRLEQLNRKLVEIRGLAIRYQSEQALDMIERAFDNYQSALADLQASPPRLIRARGSFIKANGLANQAAKILLFKPAFRYRADLENTLQKAEIAIHGNNNEDGRYFINKARAFQNEANGALQSGEYLRAQEYFRISMYFAEKAFRLAEGKDEASQGESFEDQVRNIQILLRNIGTSDSNDPLVLELTAKVSLYLERARRFYEQNMPAQALMQLRISERFLYRAVDLQRNAESGSVEKLQQDLYSLGRYIRAVESSLDEESSNSASRFLNKARQFYDEAEHAINQNTPDIARQKMNLAQRMASRALRQSDRRTERSAEQLRRRITELEHLLQLQQNKWSDSGKNGMELLHREARILLKEAQQDLENNRPGQAYFKIQFSLRLVNRIERMLAEDNVEIREDAEIQELSNRLSGLVSRLQESSDVNPAIQSQILLLAKLLQKAEQLYNTGQRQFAYELLKLVETQLNTLLSTSVN